ncbi:MAG TPA: hypothetical protein VK864_12200, partial [Longimicrobiales bacterium]|nr:hypothetical protein [Longimicrobiales bacterium]
MERCKKGSTLAIRCWLLCVACGLGCLTVDAAAAAAQLDTADLRRDLKRVAAAYERAARRQAPHRLSGSPGPCDEIVGRFCLTYDAARNTPLPPEPEGVKEARAAAIAAFRGGARQLPHDTAVAAPLVRYLIEHGEFDAALEAAQAFAQANPGTAWSDLLLGFALHYAQQNAESERAFDIALVQLTEREQRRAADVYYLLSPAERSIYKKLLEAPRQKYHRELWRLADPLFLTPGNESRTEHFARYVYARILARVPVVLGSVSWGDDIEELTRRFGVPAARTQSWGNTGFDLQITEHFEPDQLTYVPPELSRTRVPPAPLPGAGWPYDTVRVRSGFAPRTVRAMRPLEHQLSRFPAGSATRLRVDFRMSLDTAVAPDARVEAGLFVADSVLEVLAEVRDTIQNEAGVAQGWLELDLPSGARIYSVETRELSTHLAARARYQLPPRPAGPLVISDLVLLAAGDPLPVNRDAPQFHPLGSLVIETSRPIALYLEVIGLAAGGDDE